MSDKRESLFRRITEGISSFEFLSGITAMRVIEKILEADGYSLQSEKK